MDTDAKVSMGFYSESLELSNNDSHVPYQHNQQEQPLSDCINNTMVGFSAGMEFNGDEELRGIRRNSTEFEPLVGMEFDSLEAGKLFYYEYAVRTGFRARAGKCRTSLRDDSVIMKQYTCVKEGFSVKKQRHGDDHKERRNRKSMREGCKAMIQLSRRDHGKWVVSKFIPEHSHPFVDDVKVEKVKKRRQVPVIPAEFSSMFEGLSRDGGNEISLDSVLGGGESFGLLEYLKTQQSKNPAFFYSVQVDGNDHLTNVFWANAKARESYSYFGDVVMFDTSYKDNKQMLPFAAFTGYNHHLQPVVFGCALVVDDTTASLIWLFETFLVAMHGRHPVSLVSEHSGALKATTARVFSSSCHRFCKWRILSKCKEKLPDICSDKVARSTFKQELKKCIDESQTIEDFESDWEAILSKYGLRDNVWMQSLYEVRQQWARVYLKSTFFAEVSPFQRAESMKKFFKRNFEKNANLREFIVKFDQAMYGQLEKEVKEDFTSMCGSPILKTGSPMEKQAALTYTKTIFAIFQEEFIQSFAYLSDKIEDGTICTYRVSLKGGSIQKSFFVSFDVPNMHAACTCGMFTFSGILCRHALRVFSILGFCKLPDYYFLKRWKQIAKNGAISYKPPELLHTDKISVASRYNSLFLDVLKFAEEGSTSAIIYKVAKDALHKAFTEVAAARKAVCSTEKGIPSSLFRLC